MNIGDRVRLLHHKEEGVITKILDNQTVEVAIDGDFRIPVLRREVSLISQSEAIAFGKKPEETKNAVPTQPVYATQGIFLAFEAFNDRELLLHVINNTDFDLLLTFGHEQSGIYKGVFTGVLRQRSSVKMPDVMLVKDFDRWPIMVFQFMYHREGVHTFQPPLLRRMRFKAATFFRNKENAPILGKHAHLFQVDRDDVSNAPATSAPISVDAKSLKENILNPKDKSKTIISPPQTEIDLHVEKLVTDTLRRARMDAAEILACQLKAFEAAIDNAVANGVTEVTLIHGVGSGTLRDEIHKRLGKNMFVEYYKDARKEKFGYGATTVKLK